MLKDFRAFIMRGNVLDLAVAVILGGAFANIVSSFVKDILMPPVGLLLGDVDFSRLHLNLSQTPYRTLADAQAAGAPTINYGAFINTVIAFLIVVGLIFLLVRAAKRVESLRPREAPPTTTKECPYCLSTIALKATKCAYCTSQLQSSD